MSSTSSPFAIRVTEVGEYVRYKSCERRFKLEYKNREATKNLPFADRLFNSIDPVLQEAGKQRENLWEVSLKGQGLTDLTSFSLGDGNPTQWDNFLTTLTQLSHGEVAYGREISLQANLGVFQISGQIDFLVVTWENDRPRLKIVECKASRRDRTYHRIQVCLYKMMLCELLATTPLRISGCDISGNDIDCIVARIQEDNNISQDILALPALVLETEEADIRRLIAAEGCLSQIVGSSLEELDYQIESKCDDCVFSVHCLTESARERRLELLGLEPSIVRSLCQSSINNLDKLADLDLTGVAASCLRQDPNFSGNLDLLKIHAQARRKTLPGGETHPEEYEVTSLPHTGQGQLPPHETSDARRLIRVYLSIDYDYVENRIGALAAHVTKSDWEVHTGWLPGEIDPQTGTQRRIPNPDLQEQYRQETPENGVAERPIYADRPLDNRYDVIHFKRSPWSGDNLSDSVAERELIQTFLSDLVDAIAYAAETDEAPIHYYIWSRSDIAQLIEGCSRAGSRLLASLRELLGCRDSLEQIIYSCLQEEVDQRFALGWTSRGLSVATSLKWFGKTYHWQRRINGASISLHHEFTQDIFDFKTDLWIDPSCGDWVSENSENSVNHKFEIRSRFHDSLTAPYWRAVWGSLPSLETQDSRVKNAVERYNRAQKPNHLREYLRARVHALRWIEERVKFKNNEIDKPSFVIADLPNFKLGVNDTARAALDFLKLDQHVRRTNWFAQHLIPPLYRISTGRTVPLKKVTSNGQVNGSCQLVAEINLIDFDTTIESLRNNCNFGQGAFVRLTPCSEQPSRGQTLRQFTNGGITCTIQNIDWDNSRITLSVVPCRDSDLYRLSSSPRDAGDIFDYATLDESPSDFVAPKVDARLQSTSESHVYQWFHPEEAQIPPQEAPSSENLVEYEDLLNVLRLQGGRQLASEQKKSILTGLTARVQLLQGPPGTGKTETTAVAVLLKILARRGVHAEGKQQLGDIVIITAHTHTAVNNLLQRIDRVTSYFEQAVSHSKISVPAIKLSKVEPRTGDDILLGHNIQLFSAKPCVTKIKELRQNAVLIIGGTTNAILKMAKELESKSTFKGFPISTLIVDEASMMVFPHFLALSTLVGIDGEIMLTGDHRQLSPIVAHDWENEDRPPVTVYQPYVSAYQAVLNIKQNLNVSDAAILRSALSFTFRLPPLIRELVARLYERDGINLTGRERSSSRTIVTTSSSWERMWSDTRGLYLVLHNERKSRRNNETEVSIIEKILASNPSVPDSSVAVVTPHRAQRTLLTTRLEGYRDIVDVIDTVERLQGGERPTVIVSATASDPSAISKNVEFILDLNRSNVAFSRAQERLIVVCSESLLDHIPADLEHYESAMLWKSLRAICDQQISMETVNGHHVKILTCSEKLL
jgi:hypothetical protein